MQSIWHHGRRGTIPWEFWIGLAFRWVFSPSSAEQWLGSSWCFSLPDLIPVHIEYLLLSYLIVQKRLQYKKLSKHENILIYICIYTYIQHMSSVQIRIHDVWIWRLWIPLLWEEVRNFRTFPWGSALKIRRRRKHDVIQWLSCFETVTHSCRMLPFQNSSTFGYTRRPPFLIVYALVMSGWTARQEQLLSDGLPNTSTPWQLQRACYAPTAENPSVGQTTQLLTRWRGCSQVERYSESEVHHMTPIALEPYECHFHCKRW